MTSVDPKNRLIAASLEEKWESALNELELAKQSLDCARRDKPTATNVPQSLRAAFTNVGVQLPAIWPRLDDESRRALLRTLISQINIRRDSNGTAHLRIVWQGKLVTETDVQLRVFTLRDSEIGQATIKRIRELLAEGRTYASVAQQLNEEGFRPSRNDVFTPAVVSKLSHRNELKSLFTRTRIGDLPSVYTVQQICEILSVPVGWIYNRIKSGKIDVEMHRQLKCYLFPRSQAVVDSMLALKDGEVENVKIPEVQLDG